jgi:hypothetical protein
MGTSAAMNDRQIMASIWFIATVGYRVWAYKQSVPILNHRRMTFWCGLFFTFAFWQ